MIPLRLHLSHFLSYRDTAVIDFRGLHLACIAGANGSGKSSLLDAMTWALFGRSRSRSDDDVVNRIAAIEGKTAEVQLLFALENSIYRIIRRKKPRRTLQLEFQLGSGSIEQLDDIVWKSLSEGRARETQSAIEQTLNMTYDVFSNASFLLQGQADAFTTKTANRRKEILADLLGVSAWDKYRDRVNARRKETENQELLQVGRREDIDLELADEDERAAELSRAKAASEQIEQRKRDSEALLEQLRKVETAVGQEIQTLRSLQRRFTKDELSLAERRETLIRRQAERDALQEILQDAAATSASYEAWQASNERVTAWQLKYQKHNVLLDERRPYDFEVEAARGRLDEQIAELQRERQRLTDLTAQGEEWRARLSEIDQRLAEVNATLEELEQSAQTYQTLRDQLQDRETQLTLLLEERSRLQGEAESYQAREAERRQAEANISQATASIERLDLAFAQQQTERGELQQVKGELIQLESQQPVLRQEMDQLKARIERLQGETGGTCPLCGQSLSEAHRASVLSELQVEGDKRGDAFRQNRGRIKDWRLRIEALQAALQRSASVEKDLRLQQERRISAGNWLAQNEPLLAEWESDGAPRLAQLETQLADDAELDSLRQQVKHIEQQRAERTSLDQERLRLQSRRTELAAKLGRLDDDSSRWRSGGQINLVTLEKQRQDGAFALEARLALADVERRLVEVGYDSSAHQKAIEAKQLLAGARQRYQALKQAEAAVEPMDKNLADLRHHIEQQARDLEELQHQKELSEEKLAVLQSGAGDSQALESEVFELREEAIAANKRVGAAQQRLNVLDERRQQRAVIEKDLAVVRQRIQRLKLLEKACSRDGVQALLIERALPEIEDSANELLQRLTGGRMNVRFETQRQLKSRDALAETLDIHIQDEDGERPYENFSGGEQFRVNFAIRLALSRVVAGRAGVRLQTLVIDEGFGSQNPNGRGRLVEAINTIQDDFALILVITHIEELRDAFPNRIEVEKEVGGSQVTVY